MSQDSARDSRAHGYIMIFGGVLTAIMAVDRIFFHKALGSRWLTATTALVGLAGGAWMIIKRREPLGWLNDLARERWGARGEWIVTVVFAAVVVAGTWLLSRLN